MLTCRSSDVVPRERREEGKFDKEGWRRRYLGLDRIGIVGGSVGRLTRRYADGLCY